MVRLGTASESSAGAFFGQYCLGEIRLSFGEVLVGDRLLPWATEAQGGSQRTGSGLCGGVVWLRI